MKRIAKGMTARPGPGKGMSRQFLLNEAKRNGTPGRAGAVEEQAVIKWSKSPEGQKR